MGRASDRLCKCARGLKRELPSQRVGYVEATGLRCCCCFAALQVMWRAVVARSH